MDAQGVKLIHISPNWHSCCDILLNFQKLADNIDFVVFRLFADRNGGVVCG
jgi:hypothetical protein